MTSTVGTPAQPRIAIIGGGPAGLVLLVTLHRRGISATLYEREEGVSSRAHLGGTLDLGWDSGQRALRENGLQEAFEKYSRPEGDDYKFCDGSAHVLLARGADAPGRDPKEIRPEIDRKHLRQILLDAVPAESVKWGHALKSAQPLPGGGGRHALTFGNGATTVCDILIGADGGWSRVRPLVSPAVPLYTGVTGAEVSLAPDVVARPDMADIRELVGNGNLFCPEKGKMLGGQMNTSGRIRTYAWFRGPEDWRLPSDPEEARKVLLDMYAEWSPVLRKLIEHCDGTAIYLRTLYYLPVDHKWAHVLGVTLIGDAAHLMSPFAGAGANISMLDGLELGLALSEAISKGLPAEEREAAIEAAEQKMFVMAESLAARSKKNLESMMSPDAPDSAMELVMAWLADERNEAKPEGHD